MSTLYLAGPDVFRPDATAEGERLKALCVDEGMKGIFPLDGAEAQADAAHIRAKCIADIEACTAVVANVSPFRGPHMDPGTAWELGYAEARGKPIFLWSTQRQALAARIPAAASATGLRDAAGFLVEDFGAPENLMITLRDTPVHDSADSAIRAAAAYLRPTRRAVGLERLGLLHMIGIAAAVALLASWLGDKFLFR